MAVTPRIFVSATTGDLQSHRATVAGALKKLETYAEVQDYWPPDYHTVEQMLRRRLKDCDAVIHLAGLRYGAEPRNLPYGVPRRSYTQIEYHIARELKKPIYVFLLPDGFPYDDASDEDEEKRALQQAHRARILTGCNLYYCPANASALHAEVLALQPLVDKLRVALRRQRIYVTGGIASLLLISAGIAWALQQEKSVNIEQAKAISELQKPETIEVKYFKEILLLRSRSPIVATAQAGDASAASGQLCYADALAAVAKDHGLTADILRGQLDAFATRVLSDPKADAYERAIAEFHRGNYAAAISLATSAAEATEIEFKEQRQKVIESWTLVGDSEKEQVHYKEALAAYSKALKAGDKQDHPKQWCDLATNVGRIYNSLADDKAAELLYTEVLAIREQEFGKEAPETAAALTNLAALLADTQRLAEAEPLMRRALAIWEGAHGKNHPLVAAALNNLAQLLHTTNRMTEAEPLMRRALAIDEASTGEDRLHVATTLNNLAGLLRATNRLAEAEPLLRRALAIEESSRGKDHPNIAIRLNNLAAFLNSTDHQEEAEPLIRRALAIWEVAYGGNHPNVALALSNLADVLRAKQQFEDAELLMRRALRVYESSFGKDHPRLATALNNLAQLLKDTNRTEEAELLMRRALANYESYSGKDHPDIATALNNLGRLLQATNRPEEAEPLFRRALAIDEASFDKNHPHIGVDLYNLARLLQDTNRLEEAEPLLVRVLAIEEAAPVQDPSKIATSLSNLATLYIAMKRLEEAEPLLRRAVAMDEASSGKDDPNFTVRLTNLAQLLRGMNRMEEAEPLMRRALTMTVETAMKSRGKPPSLLKRILNYGNLLMEMGDSKDQAKEKVDKILEPLWKE